MVKIKRLTTKNLLALFRAERKRMYKRGYRMDENNQWINNSGSDRHFKEDVEHYENIKYELGQRPHIEDKQKANGN